MKKIRIMVVDDNRMVREGIVAMVRTQKDMLIVAFSDGHDHPVKKARRTNPDVVLVDLSGLETVEALKREFPRLKVIGIGRALSQFDIVDYVKAGASGFILKDATKRKFFSTIRAVSRGRKVLPPSLTDTVFSELVQLASRKGRSRQALRMTPREREVVVLIADGLTNKQIATKLNISVETVKSHVHNILEKLDLRSRLEIATYFLRRARRRSQRTSR